MFVLLVFWDRNVFSILTLKTGGYLGKRRRRTSIELQESKSPPNSSSVHGESNGPRTGKSRVELSWNERKRPLRTKKERGRMLVLSDKSRKG